MKVRIIPGDFGRYVTNGGSWDESDPDPLSFEVDLQTRPIKDEAVLFTAPNGEGLRCGPVQEVVTGENFVYLFIPVSQAV